MRWGEGRVGVRWGEGRVNGEVGRREGECEVCRVR